MLWRTGSGASTPAVSRPASPGLSSALASSAIAPDDPLNDYFAGQHAASSSQATSPRPPPHPTAAVPSYASANGSAFETPTPVTMGLAPSSGFAPIYSPTIQPYHSAAAGAERNPVEIALDSDNLILRGQGGEMNSAYLSGCVVLRLPEGINVKDVQLHLTAKAKVQFSDGSK